MERFYIITNNLKDPDYKITQEMKSYIVSHGKSCLLCAKDEEGHIIQDKVPKEIECAIVLGGDGTLIRAARELKDHSIPLLGVNMGTLGYLAEVELPNYKKALDYLFNHTPDIENRMMMQGNICGSKTEENVAMNDIVITREGNLRIVHFNVYVNGMLLSSYQADGMIVSTPTGSTGYNLSAGGPVVEPTASMFVITPICSHALNASSVVLSAEDTIEVEICEGRYGRIERALVSFDGADTVALETGDRVMIRKAEETTRLVKLGKESFIKIMREKMKGN